MVKQLLRFRLSCFRQALVLILVVHLTGCAMHSRVENGEMATDEPIDNWVEQLDMPVENAGSVMLLLGFSGGGTRAAAFAYGVLEELRDTTYRAEDSSRRLLDEIDSISSVSGGSFTAAYYGLFGDRIFEDYEDVFLKRNVQKTLVNGLINPLNWWKMLTTGFDRTELAIEYYNDYIFANSTFADLKAASGPYIQINATDLSMGTRFPFTQGYFDLLCSDYDSFSIARAVAASSAVPLAFAPIVLENHDTCKLKYPEWFAQLKKEAANDLRLAGMIDAVDSYSKKSERKFIHLVDGGITDNLGIRPLFDRVTMMGGIGRAARMLKNEQVNKIVVVLVNAQTRPENPMELSDQEPSMAAVINAVSDAQLQRYNTETLILVENGLKEWTRELSGKREIESYFIQVDFESIHDPDKRHLFNNIATSFALPEVEVDNLIEAARRLLRQNEEYKRLLVDLKAERI
jgi:NTE family protein